MIDFNLSREISFAFRRANQGLNASGTSPVLQNVNVDYGLPLTDTLELRKHSKLFQLWREQE
jgi:hypothetical protein